MLLSPLEQFSILSVFEMSLEFLSSYNSTVYLLLRNITLNFGQYFMFFYNPLTHVYNVFVNGLSLSASETILRILSFQFILDWKEYLLSVFWSDLYFKELIFAQSPFGSGLDGQMLNVSVNLASGDMTTVSTAGLAQNIYLTCISYFDSCLNGLYTITLGNFFYLTCKTNSLSYLILSINTSTLWLTLGFVFTVFLFLTCIEKVTLVSRNTWQTLVENYYQVILNIVNESAGTSGKKYFPLIFTLFTIILICNLLGMIPYSFTVTSHLIVTFSMALAIFIGINILGILKNGRHFLALFFPPGSPVALAPLLVMIELVSYVFRVLSLAIRLFANLMSGHTLLKILSGFAWSAVSVFGIFILPLIVILLVTGLEVAIACLQAYIFSVLICIYINDAFNLH